MKYNSHEFLEKNFDQKKKKEFLENLRPVNIDFRETNIYICVFDLGSLNFSFLSGQTTTFHVLLNSLLVCDGFYIRPSLFL